VTSKIFKSTLIAAAFVFVATVVLVMSVIYAYFSSVQRKQLAEHADLIAVGMNDSGGRYIKDVKADEYRVTWIAEDGKVKYDSKIDPGKMGNHGSREEVREALRDGEGESSRYSSTMLEKEIYVAEKLDDGSVVRIAATQLSLSGLLLSILSQLIVVTFLTLILSFFIAYRLSKRIIKPLNEMDLADREAVPYEELKPLVNRIHAQEEQIREQTASIIQKENEFEAAISGMKEGLVLLDGSGAVITVNRAAGEIFGIPDDYRGIALTDVNGSPEVSGLLHRAMAGEYAEAVVPVGEVQYELHANPVLQGSSVAAVVITIFDITEKEKAELIRKEFTANVTHELKTPLQTISGSAELLSKGLVKDEDRQGFYDTIYTETRSLIDLVDDIISLSKLEEAGLEFNKENVDLYAIAEGTVQKLEPVAERSGAAVRLEGEPVRIKGVPQLLDSIIFNLLDNAIKYSGEHGNVTVSVSEENDKAVLRVADDGIGIAEDQQERVFERFYRIDKSRSKDVGGTGLGLSIVKHAAMVHDADVEISSVLGKGTAVKVLFPLLRDENRED